MAFNPYSPTLIISNSSTIQGIISESNVASMTQDMSSEQFITPQRSPAPKFICAVNFTIYCSEKKLTKAKKTEVKWIAYKQKKDSAVTFNPQHIDLATFQKLVSKESGKSFGMMPHKIEEGTKATPPTITWGAFILQNKDWPKASPNLIANNEDFQSWLTAINEERAKRGGIVLTMENPGLRDQLAYKEAVLAKSVRAASRVASTSGPVESDGDNSSCEELDDLEVYIEMIYKKYAIKEEYNAYIPCYPHPTDSERFILLTGDNTELWAKDLLRRTPGVSIEAPPASLKYKTRKKRAAPSNAAASNQSAPLDTSQLVAIATAVAQAQVIAHQATLQGTTHAVGCTREPSPVSSDHENNNGGLRAYLDFAGIVEDQDQILQALLSEGIDEYHLFKGPHVTNEQLSMIGLNIGTIAKLRSHVNKYKRHLDAMRS
ncbi:hypothetical protein PCASD_19867 [Puccinia coronata f. sp. avenae]|uniref:Uncharacterized protein n=1 Tax=Puccinia coronata f. sp. avenae TaxID=200324 RepID=A0A2N5SRP7_9BASI|nr:hypothetical protein PCASD_19867 [Puccinia coronata f. sp. avenae]